MDYSAFQANVICIVYSVNNKKSIEKVSKDPTLAAAVDLAWVCLPTMELHCMRYPTGAMRVYLFVVSVERCAVLSQVTSHWIPLINDRIDKDSRCVLYLS